MIAYLITAHGNLSNIYSLMATIYDKDNIYLIYIDGDTDPHYVEQISGLLCFPNVYVKHGESITWNMTSILDATLWGMAALCRLSQRWHHFVLLSGDDLAFRPQDAIKKTLSELPADACCIPCPPHEQQGPSSEFFDEVQRDDSKAVFEQLYLKPFTLARDRLVNPTRVPHVVRDRKVKYFSVPRSSFAWAGFAPHVLQNFVEVPELGVVVNRPLPWFLGRVRASVIAQAGFARGPAWVVLSRSFCEFVLSDPLAMLVYAAFRSVSALDETFFQLVIGNAPDRFKRTCQNTMLTYCNWDDLEIKPDQINTFEGSRHLFCRKIQPGVSDAVVEHVVRQLASGTPPPLCGLFGKTDTPTHSFEVADVIDLAGEWKFVRNTGEDLGKFTLADGGDITGDHHPNESKWLSQDGKLLLLRDDGATTSELWCLSTDGTDVFISGDYLIPRDLGIGHTLYAPLRERFLADCDEVLISARVQTRAPLAGRLLATHFRAALLAALHADEFYWHDVYLTDATGDFREIACEADGLVLIRQQGHRTDRLACREIHVAGDDLLLLFADAAGHPAAAAAAWLPLATPSPHGEIDIRLTTGDLARGVWSLDGCDGESTVRLCPDNTVTVDEAASGLWKVRGGKLFILSTAGFMIFDKFAWRDGVVSLIGSIRTHALNPEPVRLTAASGRDCAATKSNEATTESTAAELIQLDGLKILIPHADFVAQAIRGGNLHEEAPLTAALTQTMATHSSRLIYLDVGCNHGIGLIQAAKRLIRSGVEFSATGFDPGMSAALVSKNLLLNGLRARVSFLPRAVADRSGAAPVFGEPNHSENNRIVNPASSEVIGTVECLTLDEYVASLGFNDCPVLFKVDTQGAEYEVFRGFAGTIKNRTCAGITEFTPFALASRIAPVSFLNDLSENFLVFDLDASRARCVEIAPEKFAEFCDYVDRLEHPWTDLLLLPRRDEALSAAIRQAIGQALAAR